MKEFTLEARRWQDSSGNTYNTVYVYKMGRLYAVLPKQYGYGDMWMQRAAEWFERRGFVKPRKRNKYNMPIGSNHGVLEAAGVEDYTVLDVKRKGDL